MLRMKGWPKAVLPEILKGLVQTYMALYTHELGTNPYNKKHGRQPDLSFICGDQVTFRPHRPKTAPKRIELQGKKGWYIFKKAEATVKVMEKKEDFEGENEFLFHLVHKIDVLQARKGVLSEWGFKGRGAARLAVAPKKNLRQPSTAQRVTTRNQQKKKSTAAAAAAERDEGGDQEEVLATNFKGGVTLRPPMNEEVRLGMVDRARLEEYVGLLDNEILGEEVMRAEMASVVNMGERTGIKQTPGEPKKNKGKA
uniref:Uncharacterized protein n=1 Tax=Chromera velia CCMP2878 TaxID=1169474 RepID=A0A0G4GKU1_9ALVE|eukprot:Cvel_4842.t1-p1 / transcript=Cvel_4842.t1 / gene=Cvel_4842 / organism=Chromera_velia_CCMP2878 / gene_product=hypothetical protein / transcript_product=hypothetical protein / location=Cvel_scaffold218:52535-53855(+) / protein_length=253 / sequence_SO=supercontig / SO=protein_coding / is_pseudo=false